MAATSVPAAPKSLAIALLPMYRPMSDLPTPKRRAVTSAPTSVSLHGMRRAGRILKVSAKTAVVSSSDAANSSTCATASIPPKRKLPR